MMRQGREREREVWARRLLVSAAAGLLLCGATAHGQEAVPADPPPPGPAAVAGSPAGAVPAALPISSPPGAPPQEKATGPGRRRLLRRGATEPGAEPGRTGPLARLRGRLKSIIPH
jgi:hypothetical protein